MWIIILAVIIGLVIGALLGDLIRVIIVAAVTGIALTLMANYLLGWDVSLESAWEGVKGFFVGLFD